jgi:phosphoribosylaminoimidazolecarboxamide formyltransferase/IMP cyclohydrolase
MAALSGAVGEQMRFRLAQKAFSHTAAYDGAISNYLTSRDASGENVQRFPRRLNIQLELAQTLRYGENPHQHAAFYRDPDAAPGTLATYRQLQGKELSYNNIADSDAAWACVRTFDSPACVIVKHANPCGVAIAATIEEAWERALAADPVSAFGCVALLNRDVDGALGARIAEHFVEVLMAPGFNDDAVEALHKKKALRILCDRERRSESPGERDYKRVLGGMLIQERDSDIQDREEMQIVAGEVTEQQWGDLQFAWRVCKHVSSNAIVIARDLQTIGVGAGQMSRVDSVRIAVEKARAHGHDLQGAVLASDAFFPFADGPELALGAGIAAIIQPGGSKRDADVVAAVDAAGGALIFTGRRHFRH